jgi:uncharacterized protein (DUF697 family)
VKNFLKNFGESAADRIKKHAAESKDWVKGKMDDSETAQKLQAALAQQLDGAIESVVDARGRDYAAGKVPVRAAEAIVSACAYKNAAISGGIGLVPGPWGMVAVAPEIALVIKNQIEMVYDLGVAHGKNAVLSKELLAAVLVSALSTGAAGLLVMHGGKVLVRRASLRIFQRVVTLLAGKVTQQALKSAISKWLPVAGAAFMAWLSKSMTERVGAKAIELFQQPIEIVDEDVPEAEIASAESDVNGTPASAPEAASVSGHADSAKGQ